jgi:hypothetical protein
MKFFCLVVSLLISFDVVFSQMLRKLFLSFDSQIQAISIVRLKDVEYFYFEMSSGNKKGLSFSDNPFSFQIGKVSFTFLPGSFFFILTEKSGEHIFQMLRPAINNGKTLLIPFKSFVECLYNSGLFDTSNSSKSLAFKLKEEKLPAPVQIEAKKTEAKRASLEASKTISPVKQEKTKTESRGGTSEPMPKLVLTNYERFNPKPEKLTIKQTSEKKLTPKEKINPKDTTKPIPPKYYVLPPELKNNPK